MAWPEDLFAPTDIIHDDPYAQQLALIDAELARPRTPMTAPPAPPAGDIDVGGVPAAAIHAIAPGAATPPPEPPSAPPAYTIAPHDGPAALPPEVPTPATSDPLPPEEFPDPASDPPPTDGGELDMSGDPNADLSQTRNPFDDPDASPEETSARLLEVAKTNPELAVQYRQAWETRKALAAQNDQIEALARDRDRAEENARLRDESVAEAKQMRAQIEADAQKLSTERIDNGRWWADRSVPQKIAGFVAAIVGGLVQSRTGGRNEGLAFIERAIEQDIATQRENLGARRGELARRQGLVGQLFAESQDAFRAAETARAASWASVAKELEIKAQQYDPRGSTALRMFDAANEARARGAAALQAAEKAAFDRALKIREDSRAERETALKERAEQRKVAGAGAGGTKYSPEQLAALYGTDAVPPIPMTTKEYDKWLGTKGKIGEFASKAASAADSRARLDLDKDKVMAERRIPGVMVDDGAGKKVAFVATAGTGPELEKVREKVRATNSLVRLMDQSLRIRSGWTSDTAKSAEWRQLKTNWAAAIGEAKDVLGLGALTGPDMELTEKYIGASDPTEYRDPSAGIKKARENIINSTRDSLRKVGLPDDVKWDIPDISTARTPSPDEEFQTAQRGVTPTRVIDEWRQANPDAALPRGRDLFRPFVDAGKDPSLANTLLPSTRKYIQKLGAQARSSDPKKSEDAQAALRKLTETGGNTATKAFAETTLWAALGSGGE